ncbi:MAG: DUF4249 domain-containing protein [Bacteroidetes bacterium]|nr:DUF4249 domain-containing protein [Bacteroidota bacterium]
MKNILVAIPCILGLFITGCRPEPIPIKIPQADGKLVVSSQIIPNTTLLISLSRSFNALTPTDTNPGQNLLEQILVAHARVTVEHGGITDTLLRVAPGFYGSITTPLMANQTYTLHVYDSSSGKSVTAQTTMQTRLTLDTAWVERRISGRDTQRWLHYAFTDPAGVNFYMLNTYRNTSFFTNVISNPARVFNLMSNADVNTIPITDGLFKPGRHEESMNLGNYAAGDTLTLTLSHIDQTYYTYLVQKQRAARNGLGAFFGEPVNYSSNVRGGYGFFTAHWPDVRTLIIKE